MIGKKFLIKNLFIKTNIKINNIEKIGSGTFSKVFKGEDNKKNIYCIKVLKEQKKNFNEIKSFFKEIMYLNIFSHPNIMPILGYHIENSKFSIFLPYYKYTLQNLILNDDFDSKLDKKNLTKQLAKGIQEIHKNNLIHRDIKPENILLDQNFNLVIADFGVSNFFLREQLKMTNVGTPLYQAPEVLESKYNQKCDIWSFAFTISFIYERENPFSNQSSKLTFYSLQKIIKNGERPKFPNNDLKDLINKCWNINYQLRPSADEIVDYLEKNPKKEKIIQKTFISKIKFNEDYIKLFSFLKKNENLLNFIQNNKLPNYYIKIHERLTKNKNVFLFQNDKNSIINLILILIESYNYIKLNQNNKVLICSSNSESNKKLKKLFSKFGLLEKFKNNFKFLYNYDGIEIKNIYNFIIINDYSSFDIKIYNYLKEFKSFFLIISFYINKLNQFNKFKIFPRIKKFKTNYLNIFDSKTLLIKNLIFLYNSKNTLIIRNEKKEKHKFNTETLDIKNIIYLTDLNKKYSLNDDYNILVHYDIKQIPFKDNFNLIILIDIKNEEFNYIEKYIRKKFSNIPILILNKKDDVPNEYFQIF